MLAQQLSSMKTLMVAEGVAEEKPPPLHLPNQRQSRSKTKSTRKSKCQNRWC